VIPAIVTASQAIQAAFIAAKEAGNEEAANQLRIAQFRIVDALMAATPSGLDEDGTSAVMAQGGAA
jgi:hypothetical protein